MPPNTEIVRTHLPADFWDLFGFALLFGFGAFECFFPPPLVMLHLNSYRTSCLLYVTVT